MTQRGLYCEAGDFYIDPGRVVSRAVITHAHADHARPGCKRYLSTRRGSALLRRRIGSRGTVRALEFGETIDMNGVKVSLHPAGHLLGSAQVRIEHRGEICVISGDYKVEPDPTCRSFEPVRCHTFITESTFALPVYRWPAPESVFQSINEWWRDNQASGRTSVILAYALGKAQRLLAGIDARLGPVIVADAIAGFAELYREQGIKLPEVMTFDLGRIRATKGKALLLVPPGPGRRRWLQEYAPLSTTAASGWMQLPRRRKNMRVDRGFVLSDHADWNGIMDSVRATQAENIGAVHGYSDILVRALREQGRNASVMCVPPRTGPGAGA